MRALPLDPSVYFCLFLLMPSTSARFQKWVAAFWRQKRTITINERNAIKATKKVWELVRFKKKKKRIIIKEKRCGPICVQPVRHHPSIHSSIHPSSGGKHLFGFKHFSLIPRHGTARHGSARHGSAWNGGPSSCGRRTKSPRASLRGRGRWEWVWMRKMTFFFLPRCWSWFPPRPPERAHTFARIMQGTFIFLYLYTCETIWAAARQILQGKAKKKK